MSDKVSTSRASTRRLARTRGAGSGILLVALGAWGALVPFIGPWFDFAYSPDSSWHWTAARGWLEVLPGVVTLAGGLLLLGSASRVTTSLGAWFCIAGGTWFVVGQELAAPLHLGSVGTPTGSSSGLRALESLAYFYALGALILFLAAAAFGRLSVVTVRDVRLAERREAAAQAAAQHPDSEPAERPYAQQDRSGQPDPHAQQGYTQPQYTRGPGDAQAGDAQAARVDRQQPVGDQPPSAS